MCVIFTKDMYSDKLIIHKNRFYRSTEPTEFQKNRLCAAQHISIFLSNHPLTEGDILYLREI
jgi:hypothetical protein